DGRLIVVPAIVGRNLVSSYNLSDSNRGAEVSLGRNSGRRIWKLHFWAAVIFGLPVGVLAITGCILAFREQIDQLYHRVSVVTSRAPALPLAALESVAARMYPDEDILAIQLSGQNEGAVGVRLEGHLLTMDRYTGKVLLSREDIPQQQAFLQY